MSSYMKISFEVVPRTHESLMDQLQYIEQNLGFVNTINVPDLLRFPIRSWEAGSVIDSNKYQFIPHVRAIDFDIKANRIFDIIEKNELSKILLVSGDPPPDMSFQVYDTHVLDLIKKVRKQFPHIEILGGFDPYRSSIKDEREYIEKKFDAGVDALLSQPFFDMRLLEIYSDFLPPEKTYWGVSPVITDKSKHYWERVNHAIFPSDYEPTYEWNTNFAIQVLEQCKKTGANVYFMPIRINLEQYFTPIINHFQPQAQ